MKFQSEQFSGNRANLPRFQRGVALVMTLIMLSVITFLTIAFLAISRRDRASVTTSQSQTDSHLMADTALARFQSEVTSRMMAQNSLQVYDLMLTRNYFNPTGYVDRGNVIDTNNVNYDYRDDSQPLNNTDLLHNIANLFYDPRPPVFVRTNENRALPLDFRFYLDYNRNHRFETNSVNGDNLDKLDLDDSGNPIGTTNRYVGEPEWIGVLQNPEYPHSPTNRFIGRYLYLALPISRTLDLNYVHNDGKGLLDGNNTVSGNVGDGFLRNQGVGSWEINLGAFLEDLNTNMYGLNSTVAYQYFPDATRNRGDSFSDAVSFLGYRYRNGLSTLSSVATLFPGNGTTAFSGANAFRKDLIDGYSTRPIINTPFVNQVDPDGPPANLTSQPWPGSRNPRQFFDPQDLFDTNKSSPNFVTKLQQVSTRNNSYDRYTFARLLEQIGMGSEPEVKGKININYVNDPSQNLIATNFVEWTAHQFFTNVVERLIKDNVTHPIVKGKVDTNIFYLFNTSLANLVRPDFSVTNIQIYPTNEYTAPLHRLLQVAANVYDATTSNKFPTIYRPLFGKKNGATIISDFIVETNSVFLANALTNAVQDRTNVTNPDGLVWGIPVVVAAKKGLPNFNEFLLQSSVQVSRNLEIIKRDTNSPPVFIQTNQMLSLNISNVFGLEAWNSYIQPYTNRVRLLITNVMSMALTNELGNIIWPADGKPTNFSVSARPTLNFWPSGVTSNSFILPLYTNFMFLSNSTYRVSSGSFVPYTTNYEKGTGFPTPTWGLLITNRLIYALVDTKESLGRVIDFVNLDNMTANIDLTKELMGDAFTSPLKEPDELAGLWVTNRLGNATAMTAPTMGLLQQIRLSRGNPGVMSDKSWSSYGSRDYPANKEKAIANFAKFMGYNSTITGYGNIAMPPYTNSQTPFNPTRKMDLTISWQANDPLVHFMTPDLRDSTNLTKVELRIPPNGPPVIPNNLGKMNERYRPWGRSFGGEGVGPLTKGNGQKEFDQYSYDFRVKDPRVRWSDDWEFPTNKFPSIGWLGRVHRGTPWQTIYLKAGAIANRESPSDRRQTKQIGVNGFNWEDWSGRMENHPTNDWKLMDVFTVAPNDNAARGLLSVNQTNQAAWSAVLSGVVALTNWQSDAQARAGERIQGDTNAFRSVVIQPGIMVSNIVRDINAVRATKPHGVFESLGDILSVPSLSVGYSGAGVIDAAPMLNVTNYNWSGTNKVLALDGSGNQRNKEQRWYGVNDEAYERLPQQIMSLLKLGEPQYVIYCYGQSLKPAPNSIVLNAPIGSGLFNLCTNYQITGEVVTRTVLHIEPNPDAQHPKTVIDSYNVLPAE